MRAFQSGILAHKLRNFHSQYGEVIHVAPNELSHVRPDAIRDIYAKKPNAHYKTLPKDPVRQPPPKPGAPVSILEGNDVDHARFRKGWSYAFSAQSLSAQQSLVNGYVTRMLEKLDLLIADGEPVDLQQWYSYCTFDIITSLSFGEDLQCLERGQYHEWVTLLVYSIKARVQMAACRFYPFFYSLLEKLTHKKAQQKLSKHQAFTKKKVQRRLNRPSARADFFSHFQKSKQGITDAEVEINAATMIFAGSHTLQSALTGITLQLVNHPQVLDKVASEVRQAFPDDGAISYRALTALPYLHAVIQEGMRLTSPVPLGLTRMIPDGGTIICNKFVPARAANTYPANFSSPAEFIPERWIEPGQVADIAASTVNFPRDCRDAMQPFLAGPRDCIGQNLATMEILLILRRMLWHFDMKLPPEGTFKWENQDTYAVWTRSPLPIDLRPSKMH